MILLKFREKPETRDGHHWPCSAFRLVLESGWCFIALTQQFQDKTTGEWRSSHTQSWGVSITRNFSLGIDHVYYDGPHCSLSLGFIHILWGGKWRTGWCDKCYLEERS